jgi:hypothetical protein
MSRETTSDEDAEIRLLSLANHKRKFALELGLPMSALQQGAFERGIDNEWFTLVDVASIAFAPGRVMRVFRLTEAGFKRLAELVSLKGISNLGDPT